MECGKNLLRRWSHGRARINRLYCSWASIDYFPATRGDYAQVKDWTPRSRSFKPACPSLSFRQAWRKSKPAEWWGWNCKNIEWHGKVCCSKRSHGPTSGKQTTITSFFVQTVYNLLASTANIHFWEKIGKPFCPHCSGRGSLLHLLSCCPNSLGDRCYTMTESVGPESLATASTKSTISLRPSPFNERESLPTSWIKGWFPHHSQWVLYRSGSGQVAEVPSPDMTIMTGARHDHCFRIHQATDHARISSGLERVYGSGQERKLWAAMDWQGVYTTKCLQFWTSQGRQRGEQ